MPRIPTIEFFRFTILSISLINVKGKAVTRKEFVDWMTFELGKDDRDLDLLVKAISHPTFPGPFIRFKDHLFAYQNTKGIE